jgi:hypothetical protein
VDPKAPGVCVRYRYPVPTSIPRSHTPTTAHWNCWADRHPCCARRDWRGRAEARLALLRGSAKQWLNFGGVEENIWRKEMNQKFHWSTDSGPVQQSFSWEGRHLGLRRLPRSPIRFFRWADRSSMFCAEFRRFFPFWSHHPPKCHNRPGFWSCGACRLCQTQEISCRGMHLLVLCSPRCHTGSRHWLPLRPPPCERGDRGASRALGPVTTTSYRALTLW